MKGLDNILGIRREGEQGVRGRDFTTEPRTLPFSRDPHGHRDDHIEGDCNDHTVRYTKPSLANRENSASAHLAWLLPSIIAQNAETRRSAQRTPVASNTRGGGTHVIGLSVLNQEVDEDDGDEKADGLEVLRARNRIKSQSGATQGIFSLIDRGPYLEVKLISPESNESQRSEYRDASHVQRISQSEGKTVPNSQSIHVPKPNRPNRG